MTTQSVTPEILGKLVPLSSLSGEAVREISRLCLPEVVSRNLDPFRLGGSEHQLVYLLRGELKLSYPDGSTSVVVGGTEAAAIDLRRGYPCFQETKAITDVELIRIDDDLLDIISTWDQLAGPPLASRTESGGDAAPDATDWRLMSGMFAAENLTHGAFSNLPPAHINALLGRFHRIKVKRGEEIIRQGEEGDFYYVLERGRCNVTRKVGGGTMQLAELISGDAFGEEALVSNIRRNASVVMKTDGVLLRLAKADFIELLSEPLLQFISRDEAARRVSAGAVWIDVRFPVEYNIDKIPGAINIPLNEIRNALGSLDRGKEYIVYCQSGRRSSAAAFLLAQHGYRAFLLEGGSKGGGV